jgi:hypothetical protein
MYMAGVPTDWRPGILSDKDFVPVPPVPVEPNVWLAADTEDLCELLAEVDNYVANEPISEATMRLRVKAAIIRDRIARRSTLAK